MPVLGTAKSEIQGKNDDYNQQRWIPACAGMTGG